MVYSELGTVSDHAKTVLISLNHRSGPGDRGDLVNELRRELVRRGFPTEILTDLDQLKHRCCELLAGRQLRTVVSAGGDGTASLLVNELDPVVPLTIFPMGTANLLAQYVGASLDIQRTADTISGGRMTRMDAGVANGKIFLVVASCGFDAEVVNRLHSVRAGHINYFSYALPLIHSIFHYQYPDMRFIGDGQLLPSARWVFVLNIPKYALGLRFVEEAIAHDGLLDVCTFRGGGFFRGLWYFFAVLFGKHRGISATRIAQLKQLRIESDEKVPYQLDGDPGGYLPLTIQIVPDRFATLVPADWQPT